MNCKFCHKLLDKTFPPEMRFIHYICHDCNTVHIVNATYGYRGFRMMLSNNTIYHFPFSKRPFRLTDLRGYILVELDHFPDINPQNAQRWVDKLLKLKAFA